MNLQSITEEYYEVRTETCIMYDFMLETYDVQQPISFILEERKSPQLDSFSWNVIVSIVRMME